jgi:hypothetical protein
MREWGGVSEVGRVVHVCVYIGMKALMKSVLAWAAECRQVSSLMLGVMIVHAAAGCSVTLPFLAKDDDITGSISARPVPEKAPEQSKVALLSPALDQEDMRRANASLAVALDPQGNGAAVQWDNPVNGHKGSFGAVGQPYLQSDVICRALVASVVAGGEERWYQGTGCRQGPNDWIIRDLKSWRRPS